MTVCWHKVVVYLLCVAVKMVGKKNKKENDKKKHNPTKKIKQTNKQNTLPCVGAFTGEKVSRRSVLK